MRPTILLLSLMWLAACGGKQNPATSVLPSGTDFGQTPTLTESRTLTQLARDLPEMKGDEELLLRGTIEAMCMHKGDWLAWGDTLGNKIFVQFLNHAFTVPPEARGKEVLVQGYLRNKALPAGCGNAEKEARELQQDNGKAHREHAEAGSGVAGGHEDHGAPFEDKPRHKGRPEADEGMIYFVASGVRVLD